MNLKIIEHIFFYWGWGGGVPLLMMDVIDDVKGKGKTEGG